MVSRRHSEAQAGEAPDIVGTASSTLLAPIGVPITVAVSSLTYVGQGGQVYLWAGIVQDNRVVYETRVRRTTTFHLVDLPSYPEVTRYEISAELTMHPGPNKPGSGVVDAMVLVLSRKSLARDVWLLRAVWLEQFLLY